MQKNWQKKLPLQLTGFRIFLTLPVCLLIVRDNYTSNLFATLLFILASITDYFDGYYARKYNAISVMGQYLDPVADKILVTSVLVILAHQQLISPWLVIIIAARDNFIGALRSVAAVSQMIIAAKQTGKWKAAIHMVGIPMLTLETVPWTGWDVTWIGTALLWLSVPLSLISGWDYFRAYLESSSRAEALGRKA